MKNAGSRENERDDKFLEAAPAGSMRHCGRIQKEEDRDSRRARPESCETAPGKLRRTIYRFIAIPAVIVSP